MTRVKGAVLGSLLRTVGRLYGTDAVDRAVAAMSSPAGPAFAGGLDGSCWYPVSYLDAFYEVFLPQIGGDIAMVRTIAAAAFAEDVSRFYRLLLRAFDPASVLSFGLRVWRTIYDSGEVRVHGLGPGRMQVDVAGVTGFSQITWSDVLGGIDALVALGRASGKTVRVVGGGEDGSMSLSIAIHWNA